MQQYGNTNTTLVLDGHSRGAMTIGNALESLNTDPLMMQGVLGNTNINFYGPAYNAQNAADLLYNLSEGKQTQIMMENNVADPVGRFVGNNNPTGGTVQSNTSILWEMFRAATGQDGGTSHNSYGDAPKTGLDNFWGGVKPVPQPVIANPAKRVTP